MPCLHCLFPTGSRAAFAGSCEARYRPPFTIARLEGDLDIATTPLMRERLLSVLGPGVRLLIIDMSGQAWDSQTK